MTRHLGRLRRSSRKRQAAAPSAAAWRQAHCEQAGTCDICRKRTLDLLCHEICQGNRAKAYTCAAAILVLCSGCHAFVHAEPGIWSKARQAGLLRLRRPECFDLLKLNSLLIAKLTLGEIIRSQK